MRENRLHLQAAGDGNFGSGDKITRAGAQRGHHSRDLGGRSQAAQRRLHSLDFAKAFGEPAIDSVSTSPGETMLTRIPCGPSSAARQRVSACIADFASRKLLQLTGGAFSEKEEPILMMRPDFCSIMPGIAAWLQ